MCDTKNDKLTVRPKRRYTEQEISTALDLADRVGGIAAAAETGVTPTTISLWRRRMGRPANRSRGHQGRRREADISAALDLADEYGATAAAHAAGVSVATITEWRRRMGRMRKRTRFSEAEISDVLDHAERHGTRAASKRAGIIPGTVRKWYRERRGSFRRSYKNDIPALLARAEREGDEAVALDVGISVQTIKNWRKRG